MSDAIPDEFMKAALDLANQILDRGLGDETRYAEVIARALMAAAKEADEAATKRERERCVSAVQFEKLDDQDMGAKFYNMAIRHAVEAIYWSSK